MYVCVCIYIYIYIWLPEARDDLLHEVGIRSEGHREAAQERHERRAEGPADERGAEAVCLSTSLSLSLPKHIIYIYTHMHTHIYIYIYIYIHTYDIIYTQSIVYT